MREGGGPGGGRYCPFCAAPVDTPSSAPTETRAGVPLITGSIPGTAPHHSRFLPGTVIARRYRIVGLLGRGGMGEVYRADDLKLGQPVALKFLPEEVQRDELRLSRFLNEVKVALRVSHPNVCRVHDVGEVDGQHYLSMEYVDGEDLASLLRRIGRLPEDKAIQIARQLCAGLAAAHEQGILHRDLKPANVMIDGRGRAKITDFGLADLAESIEAADVRAGTPLYMAPEQREGKEVTVRSDIYSLGLVLYELFTGKRAYEADSFDELTGLQRLSTPTSLTSHVDRLDEAVERVVLRCLEREPQRRPERALAVAAALPGGDPLAAALSAGETPSPETVADAGEAGGMSPWVGAVSLVIVLAALVCISAFYGLNYVAGRIPFSMPPEALSVEARRIIDTAGHDLLPIDRVYGFEYDDAYFDSARTRDPSPVVFWYRESPKPLVDVVPDWGTFFEAAGLDQAAFTPTRPVRNPLLDCDERQAWIGVYSDQPDLTVRVEAGSYRGKSAYFEIIPQWTAEAWSAEDDVADWLDALFYLSLALVVLIGGSLVARQNLRLGRGDRRGATRVAIFALVIQGIWMVLHAHHVWSLWEFWLIGQFLAFDLFAAVTVWIAYVALEPYARKTWPDGMVSWSRLIAGRFRDPLIGRDIVIGAIAGVLGRLTWLAYYGSTRWLALPADDLVFGELGSLVGVRQTITEHLSSLVGALQIPIFWLFVLLLLTRLFRRRWAAVTFAVLFMALTAAPQSSNPWLFLVFMAVSACIFIFTLTRFGLVAGMVWAVFMWTPECVVLTVDPSAWYAGRSFLTLLLLAALAGYGFWVSQAGHPLKKLGLSDDQGVA